MVEIGTAYGGMGTDEDRKTTLEAAAQQRWTDAETGAVAKSLGTLVFGLTTRTSLVVLRGGPP